MKQLYKVGNAIFTENRNIEMIFEHLTRVNDNKTIASLLTFTQKYLLC